MKLAQGVTKWLENGGQYSQTRTMFSRIRYKLFVAILIANALLLVVVFLSASWMFSTSFREYLDSNEADRLLPMTRELASVYQRHGGWDWIRGSRDRTWNRLMREYLGVGPGPPPPNDGNRRPEPARDEYRLDRPPPPRMERGPPGVHPGILLKDATHGLLVGPPQRMSEAYWIPIELEDETVGYLGFVRRHNIDGELDRLFAARVKSHLAWLLLGMLLITALIAVPLAGRFVVPIEKLRAAMHQLSSGNYEITLEKQGSDEIAELQGDFNRLADTMSRNLALRQRWIADISHELRTPVAVLRGEIEAILDGVRKPDQVYIKSLHQEIMRLSHLIDDLYELSLSDQGAMNYQNRELDLREVLAAIIEQQNSFFETEEITIEFSAQNGSYPVFGDSRRLQQLFSNLANNSRFYTEKPGSIRVKLTRSDDRAIIEWSDSAPGVSDAQLARLFERLYRVEKSRARNAGGSGLGLSICRNIVEAMQGTINAAHAPLGGVSMTINLPLMD
ncbi:MAG: HAMP domain-containing protein [Gammaproteobacteria bacterium]|nr:HAMP domain-containing protein [Gammaproteobacteria bacterium]